MGVGVEVGVAVGVGVTVGVAVGVEVTEGVGVGVARTDLTTSQPEKASAANNENIIHPTA